MADETKIESIVTEQASRRSAIKTAAQVAVTAPAVGLLLSAGTKSAMAQNRYNFSGIPQTGDDTFFADDGGRDDGTVGDDNVPNGPNAPK
jgi:hypothetical protein